MEESTPEEPLLEPPAEPPYELPPFPAEDTAPDVLHMVKLAVVFEGGLIVIALILGWLCGTPALASFSWSWNDLGIGLIGTIPLVVGLLVIDRYPLGPFADLKDVVDEMIIPLFRNVNLAQLALIALLAGIGEEMLFRGVLQAGLADYLSMRMEPAKAAWIALFVASAVFGMMHPITRMYALLCFLVGLYLGWIWMWSGNLLGPIVIHALYDFVALVYLVRGQEKPREVAA